MKKRRKSGAFKILTFIVCVVMTAMASGINTFAAATTQTTNETCPYGLCSKKLMISGPYGLDDSVVDSAVPFIGGKTYQYVYSNYYTGLASYRENYHMYAIYCTKYNHDNASLIRHTLTLMFPEHVFTPTSYEKYNASQHTTTYTCSRGQITTSAAGTTGYCLSQTLCGENAELDTSVMRSLMETYDTVGCGKTKQVLELHTWSYTDWAKKDGTYHSRTGTCSKCGETKTENAIHSYNTSSWTSTGSAKHKRTLTCTVCGYSYEETANHSWTYSDYTSVDGTKHSVKRTCSVCGYTDTIEQNHNLTYSDWISYAQFEQNRLDPDAPESMEYHVRTKTCSDCGYIGYEYAEHNHVRDFEGYRPYEATGNFGVDKHYYTVHCTVCTHGIIYLSSHRYNKNQNVYTDISDTQHHVEQTCLDCEFLNEYDEDHTFTTTCEPVSDTRHKFTASCVCGHTNISYGDHHDDDSDCYCDDCGYLMTVFSVTVPATLSLVMDKDGNVYTPTNASIANNSTAAVKVTGISLSPKNGWSVVPYSTNMANEKVDSHKIGLKLRDSQSASGNTMPVTGNWDISQDGNLPLTYSAVVSATSQPISGTNVLDVTFVIDWRD